MNKEFDRAYKLLNQRQREAVDQIDGPVLVIAGPGTGKTQLLSTRVANILHKTDTQPGNILCLTFTNKAAINMKNRIVEQIGTAGARVAASTFHSFAAEIMNLYPDYFWNSARLSVAPDAVQLDVIESIVKQLPLDNPLALKFAGQYTLLADIKNAIKLAKDAGLTPDKLRAIINANLAYLDTVETPLLEIFAGRLSAKTLGDFKAQISALPTQDIDEAVYPLISLSSVLNASLEQAIGQDEGSGKCGHTSKWKGRWVQTIGGQRGMWTERSRNNWWLQLADVYEQYRAALHQRGFYDYSDMLVEVLSQLEQHPEILADVQERFSYVLIDEFQDTTPAQLRLAHLVANHFATEGKPNLMAVGDDDQSIFKFNGAELNNMLGFKRAYPSSKIVILTDSYRSTQKILDTAKAIIEQAQSRLVNTDRTLDKQLVAKSPPEGKSIIRALSYPSGELQLSLVARDIKQSYKPGKDIAVLARGHDSLIKMAGLLQSLGVPVRYEQASNILEHEIVNQVYLIVRLLLAVQEGDKDEANALIHHIIRWPVWGIDPQTLWQLAVRHAGKDWLGALLSSPDKVLQDFAQWVVWLAKQTTSQPLPITIEQILGLRDSKQYTSPIKSYFMDANQQSTNRYFRGLSAIQLLRALVHEFAATGEPTIAELARFIEVNKENGIVVADESPFITGTHAVQLLSVHKAKGLEFDSVYIVDATQDNWQPRRGSRKPPSNLPLQPAGDDFDDYVRLMYVAATRAKSALTISSYYQDHAGKDVAASTIVQAALPIEKQEEDDEQKLITVLEENLRWPALDGGLEKEMLKARLETYNLAVTHLQNFLDVTKGGPQYFKERNLLRLPEAKTASLSYGTAVHAALEAAQIMTNKSGFNLTEVERVFVKALTAEQLPSGEYRRYIKKGQQTLAKLFNDFDYQLPKEASSEKQLRDITSGRALIGGKLDRVVSSSSQTIITDYKTGRPLSSFSTNDKTLAIKAYKHKMQLVFYALLMRQSAGIDKIEGQMVYVDAETHKDLVRTHTPSTDEIIHLQKLIDAVWPLIINLKLPDTSAYSQDIDGIKSFEADLLKKKYSPK